MNVWVLRPKGYEAQDVEVIGVYKDPEKAKAAAEAHFTAEHSAFFQTEGGKWSFWDNFLWIAEFPKQYDAYHGYNIRKYELEE